MTGGTPIPPGQPGQLLTWLVRVVDGHVRFVVRAKPRSSREGIALVSGAIVVKVRAPPVDGAANEAIVACIAEAVGARKSDVSIVRGESARDKEIEVRGLSHEAVIAALRALTATA